jgi:hypothetical protein
MESLLFFEKRKSDFVSIHAHLIGVCLKLSWTRTFIFLGCITAFIWEFNSSSKTYFAFSAIIGLIFYTVVMAHRKKEQEKAICASLETINNEEIDRINLKLSAFTDGNQYKTPNHTYQDDLDIFGRHSLFQLINRCEIEDSQALLAKWLSNPSTQDVITKRQLSTREIVNKTDWSQNFQASARIAIDQKRKNEPNISSFDIVNWAKRLDKNLNVNAWRILSYSLGIIAICCIMALALMDISHLIIYPTLGLNTLVMAFALPKLNANINGIDKSYHVLRSYQQALFSIENEAFESEHLIELKSRLKSDTLSATAAIKELADLSYKLSARSSMFYWLINIPFLLDIHLLVLIHQWKNKYGREIESWFATVNEIECLISLAGFSRANPSYSFPMILAGNCIFKAKKMGHPLIADAHKIRNEYHIDGQGRLDIITGSNMSGKSTFQRTVGINMVLAQCGSPVDASHLEMSTTAIFTSMRTKDNLEEHTSSFYAELKRISELLELTKSELSIFYILDELLKGTNSEDRHKGSVALAEKLCQKNAFGMISTHDLSLGALAETHDLVKNYSFNSEIINDKIKFDYRLTEGVCKSFNASQLMKNMGIL